MTSLYQLKPFFKLFCWYTVHLHFAARSALVHKPPLARIQNPRLFDGIGEFDAFHCHIHQHRYIACFRCTGCLFYFGTPPKTRIHPWAIVRQRHQRTPARANKLIRHIHIPLQQRIPAQLRASRNLLNRRICTGWRGSRRLRWNHRSATDQIYCARCCKKH